MRVELVVSESVYDPRTGAEALFEGLIVDKTYLKFLYNAYGINNVPVTVQIVTTKEKRDEKVSNND